MFKKILISGGITSIIGAIGICAFLYLKNTSPEKHSIDKLFNKLGNRIKLVYEEKYVDEWAERWGKYITANTTDGKPNDKDIWGLEDWKDVKHNKRNIPESFAKKCEEQLNLEVKDDKDTWFLNYIEWCTKIR